MFRWQVLAAKRTARIQLGFVVLWNDLAAISFRGICFAPQHGTRAREENNHFMIISISLFDFSCLCCQSLQGKEVDEYFISGNS
ncbi:hypothetical protein NC652_001117 [Populus alba x Populus x berolinensis]|nr:hypothetical protein NC652_001117 [Populus alba x Populus x berolinensis]